MLTCAPAFRRLQFDAWLGARQQTVTDILAAVNCTYLHLDYIAGFQWSYA